MSARFANSPFDLAAPCDFGEFRELLRRADYSEGALRALLALSSVAGHADLPVLERRLATPTPWNRLVRLFYLGNPLAAAEAQALLGAPLCEHLQGTGLLRTEAGQVRATAKLIPYRHLYVLGDFLPADSAALPPDHVLSVGAASSNLAGLTVRRPGVRVLDVGTGAGIQGLLAASHAASVVGTDTNRRALNFAAFNARLNGIENFTVREGSFFEPVAGERFDLVVANPPFVISPESRFLFRDGGLGGDSVSEHVVAHAGEHLTEGGFAVVLINWHHRTEADWAERPTRWAAGHGCDGWLLRFKTADPLTYAADWLRPTERADPAAYGRRLDEWLAYYRQEQMPCLSAGAVILRRRAAGPNWWRCDSLPGGEHQGDCSEQIQRVFAAEDFLQAARDERRLLEARFRLHPDHLVEQQLALRPEGWTVRAMTLRPTRGILFHANVDAHVLRLLTACDGQRPLREAVAGLAKTLETDYPATAAVCAEVLRNLLQMGLLEPLGDPAPAPSLPR